MDYSRYKSYCQGAYYHIYNRGNAKQDIFLERADYIRYLELVRRAKEKYKASVICYCLMPNHIHLLVRQDSEIPIYKFVSSSHTTYSMYFNKKYDRVGHLFQGRFKQKNIKEDEYLFHLSCYIHLNPFIDKLVKKIEDYQWSSYLDYIGIRSGTLCEKGLILREYTENDYRVIVERGAAGTFVFQGLSLRDCP